MTSHKSIKFVSQVDLSIKGDSNRKKVAESVGRNLVVILLLNFNTISALDIFPA